MKNKVAQLQVWVSRIDRRQIQFAYLGLFLIAAAILHTPVDGGGGPF